jgi:hypothetical protein
MKWEARRVPFEERAPIALKTLELIEGTAVTLEALDALPLVVLVGIDAEDRQSLHGLFWLAQSGQMGSVAFFWTRSRMDEEAGSVVAAELELLAREMGIRTIVFAAPPEVAEPLGFVRQNVWAHQIP